MPDAHRVPRVALLTNAPAPYRTPFFNELARSCDLLVVFDTKREPDREWAVAEGRFRFDWVLTKALSFRRQLFKTDDVRRPVLQIPLNVVAILRRYSPDLVVSDELGVRTAWAALFCRLYRRPLIVWWEGVGDPDGAGRLTTLRRKLLARRATRVWGTGVESARSLAILGVRDSQVDLGMTGTETAHWRTAVDRAYSTMREPTRGSLGLRGAVLLFVGRLTPLKGVPQMLKALSRLYTLPGAPPWSVLFVGSGPLREAVQGWANSHPQTPVVLTGFVQPDDLPKYYAVGDVFVMPSLRDVWPLVCLEALAAGLPQVTSTRVGAAPDLVTSSEVGDIIDSYDEESFAQALFRRVSEAPSRVNDLFRDEAISKWSADAIAARAQASIALALNRDFST